MKPLLLITCFFIVFVAFTQPRVEQLTSVVQTDSPLSSVPETLTVYNNKMLFTASMDGIGRELWVSDGTANGTTLVKDINPGQSDSFIHKFVLMKGKAYFHVYMAQGGYQLWTTDGTSSGTKPVAGNIYNSVREMTTDGNMLYFLNKEQDFVELWKSDGTAEGTVAVKNDILAWNSPANLTVAGGLIYFSAQPYGVNDTRVWRSDGTNTGTFPITVELDGDGTGPGGTSHPSRFLEYKGNLYFIARQFSQSPSVGLVKSDGTVAGTLTIKGMHNGNSDLISYGKGIVHNDKMYFSFFDEDDRRMFIWESDGTAANTVKIFDHSASTYYAPSQMFGRGNFLYFTAGSNLSGTFLTKLDLTTKFPHSLGKLADQFDEPFIFIEERDANFIIGGATGNFYIGSVHDSFGRWELWTSDGTVAGTIKLSNIKYATDGAILGNKLYFSGTIGAQPELWSTAGTVASTALVKTINPGFLGLRYFPLNAFGDKVLFTGIHPTTGTEPWVSDGTVSGTHILRDFNQGTSSSFPTTFLEWNGQMIFRSTTSTTTTLYKSDGTDQGTSVFVNLPAGQYAYGLLKNADETVMYILAYSQPGGLFSLYKLQKDQSTPEFLKSFGENMFSVPFRVTEWTMAGPTLYMLVEAEGTDLWKSDGTAAGTVKVADHPSDADELVSVGNNVFYIVNTSIIDSQGQIVKSDGTAAGTVVVKDFTGTGTYEPHGLTAFGNKVAFNANDKVAGREMWVSDGTTAGTKMIKDIYPGISPGVGQRPAVAIGDSFYFSASNATNGFELWRSDGTADGTRMVEDIMPGAEGSSPQNLTVIDGKLYFGAYTTAAGMELWTSDGTEANTTMVADILPGPQTSNPGNMTMAGDRMIFWARTATHGIQLWSYSLVTGLEDQDESFVVYPNPSNDIFNIKIPGGEMQGGLVEVFSADGRRVRTGEYSGDGHSVDLNGATPGIYLIRVLKNSTSYTRKVLKL